MTDPNPPITYSDLYLAIKTLVITPFKVVKLPPIGMVLLSYLIETYTLLRLTWSPLKWVLPTVSGDAKHLKPAIFSICTHLVASNDVASQPVTAGGLGYRGILTTLEGMTQEVLEWNAVHQASGNKGVAYQTSVSLAEEIQKATVGQMMKHGNEHEEINYAMMK